MKICFYSRFDQAILYPKMARFFKNDGVESIFVTQEQKETQIVRELIPSAKIYEIESYLKNNWDKFDISYIAFAEKKYNIDSIWKLFYTDRFLVNFNYEDSIKFIVGHIKFYEEVFEKEKPNYFINEPVAIFSAYIEYYIGKYYNVQYYGFQVGRIETDSKVFLIKDPFQMNFVLDEKFNKGEFTEEQLANSKKYIDDFRKKGLKPEAEKVQRVEPRFKIKFLYHVLAYILCLFRKKNYNKFNYMHYRQNIKKLDPIIFWLRYKCAKKWFKPIDTKDKFYYYPIHFEPEAATLICGEKFKNQINTIELISENIPGDSKLYVKEHYTELIHKKLDFYKKIKDLPNVRLIDPFINSHELIKKSEGVITITGTGGWEAMLYGKSVYVLGNIFYDTYPGVNKIRDIEALLPKIKSINLNKNDEVLTRYIAAYIESLNKGSYNFPSSYVVSDENAENLYKVLSSVIK